MTPGVLHNEIVDPFRRRTGHPDIVVKDSTEVDWRLLGEQHQLLAVDDEPQKKGRSHVKVFSCDSLLSRSAHDQPIIEVLKNQHVPETEEGCDRVHHASEDPP